MSEFLLDKTLEKSNLKDSNINSSGKDDLPKYDIVLETLKHIRSRSKLKKHLAYILALFYSCQIAILLISFLIGFFSFGLPLLIIYNNLVKSIIIPILIIPIFSLLYSLILIIISIVQAKKRKVQLIEKWERKNLLKNIGAIITSIIIIVSLSLLYQFYSKVILDLDKEDIIVDYEESKLSENFKSDFVFKYILYMISIDSSSINENNHKKIQYYFSGEEIINELRNYLMISLIPLLILSFNKVVKSLIIKVKHTIGQLICFLGCFFFCLFNIIINSYTNETIKTFNIKVISIFQNINVLMVYIGYIILVMLNSVKFVLNPKDKKFSILKYKCTNIILIILFDIVLIIGATLFTLSGIYLFIYSFSFNDEIEFKKIKFSFFFLKYGFLLLIIGNSYYFGHYLLSLIFRPIAIQYTPYNLKNDYYIKPNRKLKNFLNIRKNVKLKDVQNNKI